jgi:4-hydroxy-tetrahydrodipicolinate synthase
MSSIFKGSCVALVTPFTETGVNFDALGQLLDWQIAEGTDAILLCGTTGEPSTMTWEERKRVIDFGVKRVAGRVPVIAGTGGNSTQNVIEASRAAEDLGADALLVVTPYYNKATPKGLVAHYHAVAEHTHSPIIVYNVPSRTGVNVLPPVMKRLAEHPRVRAIKEASGNIEQITELARLCPEVDLYSGNDDHVLPLMVLGGLGVISVVANIAPRDTHDMVARYLAGDIEGARQLQFQLNPLTKKLFSEVNPIPVKTALNLMGWQAGPLRMPLCEMEDEHLTALRAELARYGLMKE